MYQKFEKMSNTLKNSVKNATIQTRFYYKKSFMPILHDYSTKEYR